MGKYKFVLPNEEELVLANQDLTGTVTPDGQYITSDPEEVAGPELVDNTATPIDGAGNNAPDWETSYNSWQQQQPNWATESKLANDTSKNESKQVPTPVQNMVVTPRKADSIQASTAAGNAATIAPDDDEDESTSGWAPIPLEERTFDEKRPELSAYNTWQRQYADWAPTILSPAEQEKRTRQSAQVAAISRLGQAISALQGLRTAVKGGPGQKPIEASGTAPLKEWLKEQETKKKEAAKLASEARQADTSEWKSDYQAWLAQKKANESYNDRVRMENSKMYNDYAKELRKRGYTEEDAARALNDWKEKHNITVADQKLLKSIPQAKAAGSGSGSGSSTKNSLSWKEKRNTMVQGTSSEREKRRISALDTPEAVDAEWEKFKAKNGGSATTTSAEKKKLWED